MCQRPQYCLFGAAPSRSIAHVHSRGIQTGRVLPSSLAIYCTPFCRLIHWTSHSEIWRRDSFVSFDPLSEGSHNKLKLSTEDMDMSDSSVRVHFFGQILLGVYSPCVSKTMSNLIVCSVCLREGRLTFCATWISYTTVSPLSTKKPQIQHPYLEMFFAYSRTTHVVIDRFWLLRLTRRLL